MAKDFYECAKNGGKVISKKTKDGQTIKLCYDKEGNSHLKKNFKKKKSWKKKPQQVQRFQAASVESLRELANHFNNRNSK